MAADVEKLIKDAGEHADELRSVGFHCPEAVLRGTARALGLQVDEGVLRATTGLRGGGGGAGDRCGALEGGAILIGFLCSHPGRRPGRRGRRGPGHPVGEDRDE